MFLAGLLPGGEAEVALGAIGFVMQLSITTWTVRAAAQHRPAPASQSHEGRRPQQPCTLARSGV